FQKKEIESAEPKPGEDAALDQERRRLMNLGRIQESAGAAFAALYDSPESALALVRAATKKLDEVARIDASVAPIRETLEPAAIAIQEASYTLRDYLDKLEANPARQEQLEERLAVLDKLKRKYGATLEEVIAFLAEVREQISAVENAGERMAALGKQQTELAARVDAAAARRRASGGGSRSWPRPTRCSVSRTWRRSPASPTIITWWKNMSRRGARWRRSKNWSAPAVCAKLAGCCQARR